MWNLVLEIYIGICTMWCCYLWASMSHFVIYFGSLPCKNRRCVTFILHHIPMFAHDSNIDSTYMKIAMNNYQTRKSNA